MKKSTNQIQSRHKLVVRRETIALLASRQLGQIAGGGPETPNVDTTIIIFESWGAASCVVAG